MLICAARVSVASFRHRDRIEHSAKRRREETVISSKDDTANSDKNNISTLLIFPSWVCSLIFRSSWLRLHPRDRLQLDKVVSIFFRFAGWVKLERCVHYHTQKQRKTKFNWKQKLTGQHSFQRPSTFFLLRGSTNRNSDSRTYIQTSKVKGYCSKLQGLTNFHKLDSNLFNFFFIALRLAALTLSIQRRKGQISCMSSHVLQWSSSQNVRLVSFLRHYCPYIPHQSSRGIRVRYLS